MAEKNYDETDRRLISALHDVEVPADLETRLQQALRAAAQSELSQPLVSLGDSVTSESRASNPVHVPSARFSTALNRRTLIAAGVAAGLGGVVLGYRELTKPLSQSWLIKSTQSLLAQLQQPQWQTLESDRALQVKQELEDVGFLRQVRGIALLRICPLQPPLYVQAARALDLGNELTLLELTIERGVQGLSSTLGELEWSRSDSVAVAMQRSHHTLVLTGPAALRSHILPARTT